MTSVVFPFASREVKKLLHHQLGENRRLHAPP